MNIFLTLLSTDSYLPYVLTLYQSYLAINSKYPLIVATGDKISKITINILNQLRIPHISVAEKFNTSNLLSKKNQEIKQNNGNYVGEKINFLNLTQYEKICALDADMIMLKNIDNLFDDTDDKNFYSTSEFFQTKTKFYSRFSSMRTFNCGFILFKPNTEIGKLLRHKLENNKEKYCHEASLFGETIYELENLKLLPNEYNFIDAGLYQHSNETLGKDINIFHFVEKKPLIYTDLADTSESTILSQAHKKGGEFYSKVQVKLSKIETD